MSQNLKILLLILLILVIGAGFFWFGVKQEEKKYLKNIKQQEKIYEELKNISIETKSFSIQNLTTGEKIYGFNDQEILPLASLAKIMTVLVALENFKLNETIILNNEAIKQNGDFGLFNNEKWKIEDLIKLTLITSANDGAFMFSVNNEKFLEKMNAKAQRIGMNKTTFFNTTGLDLDDNKSGAYSTAEDVNKMINLALFAYPKLFQQTIKSELVLKSESNFFHKIKNTNLILEKIPNIIFSKTGFTETAGGNLSIVFRNKNNEKIAITLLGSSINGRFSDMEKIVNIIYNSN